MDSVWFSPGQGRGEIRPSVPRWTLEHQDEEAATVRMLFRLYVAGSGAKSVAIQLNERGLLYRRGRPWSTKLVLHVLDEPAVAGTYYWGRWSTKRKTRSHEAEWVPLPVTPIVTPAVHELAMKLRKQREPSRRPGRPVSPANLLAGVVRCGKCGASYQLESSGNACVATCTPTATTSAASSAASDVPCAQAIGSGRTCSTRRCSRTSQASSVRRSAPRRSGRKREEAR